MCSTPSLFCFILIHFFHLPLLVPFSVVSPLRFLTISLLSSLFLSPLFVPSLLFPLFPRISHSFSLFAFSGLPSDFSLFLSLSSVVPSDFSLFLFFLPCFFVTSLCSLFAFSGVPSDFSLFLSLCFFRSSLRFLTLSLSLFRCSLRFLTLSLSFFPLQISPSFFLPSDFHSFPVSFLFQEFPNCYTERPKHVKLSGHKGSVSR